MGDVLLACMRGHGARSRPGPLPPFCAMILQRTPLPRAPCLQLRFQDTLDLLEQPAEEAPAELPEWACA